MLPIEINLDSTVLGKSGCMLNLVRNVLGEIPTDSNPEQLLGGYREKRLSCNLVYGIAVHAFLDQMFKTGGHYPTARKEAEEIFTRLDGIPNKKSAWLSDVKHMITTCFNVWNTYVMEDSTFEILQCKVKCPKCKGEGSFIDEENTTTCSKCNGNKVIDGPASEITFSIPFFEDSIIKVNLCGTIDTVGKIINGCYAIRDWKTTSAWDNKGYFQQYELSRQLRMYRLACKIMSERYPDSIMGQIGATKMGAFIDGIFLKSNANDTVCARSDVYQYSDEDIKSFEHLLVDKIKQLSFAISSNYLPKEGILNGSCEGKFSKCSFWNVCKSNDTVAKVLLNRDFIRKPFDPLAYNI